MVEWFRFPRQCIQALLAIAQACTTILDRISDHGDLVDRLDKLERSRALWEAEMEGRETKVDDRWKAVRAAEERTRLMIRRAEEGAEGDDDETDVASGNGFPASGYAPGAAYAPTGGAQGVPAMPSRVAARSAASDRKWGRG